MNEPNLDRDLRALMLAGPQAAPERVVDRALVTARATRQRRPRIARLDARAWPPTPRSVADPAVQRSLRVLIVVALVLLLAIVVAVGARVLDRPPSITIVAAGNLGSVVISPRAVLWPDGRIMVEGQNGAPYLFDPTTGAIDSLSFGTGWNLARADVLPDGRVVLTKSHEPPSSPQTSIDVGIYDRATGAVHPSGSIPTPWFGSSMLVLRDGRILISGGVVFPSTDLPCGPLTCEVVPTPAPTAPYATSDGAKDTVRVFDPISGTTTDVGHLQLARFQHQMVELDDGRILVVGGGDYQSGSGEALEIEVFDLATGTSKVVGSLMPGFGPISPPPVRLDDGRILIPDATVVEYPCGVPTAVAGQPAHPEELRLVYRQPTRVFDPRTDRLTDGPTMPHYVGGNVVSLAQGRVLAFGTYVVVPADCASPPAPRSWLAVVDVGQNTVFEAPDATREYGAGILLADGRVALVGDDPSEEQKNAIDIVTIRP